MYKENGGVFLREPQTPEMKGSFIMKKIICAVLALVLVLGLAACGSKQDDNGGKTDVELTAQEVLDKLKEFVKNLREYFAHVNPNTKVEATALKENTESGMRYLEKIVEAFDKTAEAAVENYQQGTTESAAESKAQYKTRGKYWRPDLKDSEWQLLERRMAEEIGSGENYLDDATKWVYAEEKGVQVFALYGIGDGTDATPLYASAGRTARADAKMLMDYTVEENQYDGNRKDLNTLLEGYGRSNGNGSRNFSDGKRGSAKNRVVGLSGGSQRSDTGGTAERSSENQRMGVLGIFRAGRDQKACQYACDSRVNARLIESIPGQYAAQDIGQRMMNISPREECHQHEHRKACAERGPLELRAVEKGNDDDPAQIIHDRKCRQEDDHASWHTLGCKGKHAQRKGDVGRHGDRPALRGGAAHIEKAVERRRYQHTADRCRNREQGRGE